MATPWGKNKSQFQEAARSVYVRIDLDAMTHNVNVLRSLASSPLIAVVKAGAYGHGSVVIARHLKALGVERLAVATIHEGIHLRSGGIAGPIHVFGSILGWEMGACLEHDLIPTVTTLEAVKGMGKALLERWNTTSAAYKGDDDGADEEVNGGGDRHGETVIPRGSLHIKVDTGMTRNGCKPDELPLLLDSCKSLGVHVEGVMTHFASSWDDEQFTDYQLNTFLDVVKPFRSDSLKIHAANTGAIVHGVGLDMDFMRSGAAIYGLPPIKHVDEFTCLGLRPIASILATPSHVKRVGAGSYVGYDRRYEIKEQEGEWIATFQVGYVDGLMRHLTRLDNNSSNGSSCGGGGGDSSNCCADSLDHAGFLLRTKTAERCPIVGVVSMDTITVRMTSLPEPEEEFAILTADFASTSAVGVAKRAGTVPYEVVTRLSTRLPRVYVSGGKKIVVSPLDAEAY